MKNINRANVKNKNYQKNSYSKNKNFFAYKILKFNIAIALSILLFSLIVNAGDVVVENGKLDVSSNLYVDSTGKVGIGTTNPGQKLEVIGNIAVSGTVDGRDVSADGAKLDGIAAGAADTTSDSWSGIVDVTMTSGKVGIGTTSPSRKLHVKDTADNVVVIDSGDGTTQRYSAFDFYNNGAAKWGIGKNPAGDFYIDQFGVGSAITILGSNRNVGIGTSTPPTEKLDVAGNVRGTGFCIGSSPCITSWPSGGSGLPSGTSGQTLRHDGSGWVASPVLQNNGIDTVTIQRGDEATLKITNTGAGGKSWALISSGSGGLGGAGKFSIYDTSGGGNSRLLIDTNGNVGIGTTGPANKLDVSGTVRSTVETVPSSGTGTEIMYNPSQNRGLLVVYDRSANAYKRVDINDVITVSGGGSSGKVGIGTASPGAKLHVVDGGFRHGYPGEINIDASGVIGGRFKILDNGNVGIGTTGPAEKLVVSGNTNTDGRVATFISGLDQSYITVGPLTTGGGYLMNRQSIGAVGLGMHGNSPALWVTAGNVGIGTTSPDSRTKLQIVNGWLKVSGTNHGDPASRIGVGNNWWMSENTNGYYAIHQNGVGDKLTVDTSGNVGIGTTNPTARLQVGGELRADWAHIAWHRINWGDVENTCGGSHTGGGGRTHLFGTDIHGGCGDAGWIRYYSDGGGNENLRLEMRIQNDGDDDIYIRGSGGTTTGTGDLAELYYSVEELQLGDVVVMDTERPNAVKKSTQPYQSNLVGATSAKPFALLMATNEHILDNTSYKPTSLAGKIIVKVSLENGVIKPGDALTSSSMPGYAMKATRAGQIIGYAFEGFDGSERSSHGVEQMYHDVSVGCVDCEQRLRVFERSAKSSPGTYQNGVMTMLVNTGYWEPGTELKVLQDKVLMMEDENLQLKDQLLHLEKRVATLEKV